MIYNFSYKIIFKSILKSPKNPPSIPLFSRHSIENKTNIWYSINGKKDEKRKEVKI